MQTNYAPNKRISFDAKDIWSSFPPHFGNENKQRIFARAYPPGTSPTGEITVTQWDPQNLLSRIDIRPQTTVTPDYYNYETFDPAATEWHVNFADSNLFGYYNGTLFAQDELQVCEHPVLASVKGAVQSEGWDYTERNGKPYPVLVKNAERRCHFDLQPHPELNLPLGIYGNAFCSASERAIHTCTQIVEPPPKSNIIAMAAPPPEWGTYTAAEIEQILITAYTAFSGAVKESADTGNTVIHTGWWGCGAFGGNRNLMAILQYTAAAMAGVETLVFHAGDKSGTETATTACNHATKLLTEHEQTKDLVTALENLKSKWGKGNGT